MTNSPDLLYERERVFNKTDPNGPPRFGVCFSGGGNRSAAFSIGVLRALHELELLGKIDLLSAVSGGTYALSWYLLQQYYHQTWLENGELELARVLGEMFDLDGPFQRHLESNAKPLDEGDALSLMLILALTLPADLAVFNAIRILSLPLTLGSMGTRAANVLNAQSFARVSYREGIQATYHTLPVPERKASAQKLSLSERSFIYAEHLNLTKPGVPPVSIPTLSAFAQQAGLPGFIFNTTVRPPHPGENAPLRHRIFEIGPMGFGSDSSGYLTWEETEGHGWEPGAPVDKKWFLNTIRSSRGDRKHSRLSSPYATIRSFNVAPAISGAALSGTNIAARRARY